MKNIFKVLVFTGLMAGFISMTGCSYGGVAGVGKEHVVVAKTEWCLWGLLKKIYVCKATPSGLTNCKSDENPGLIF